MQPITIEPLSYIALVIIVLTLVYSFFSYRKKDTKKIMPQPQQIIEKKDYDERPALVAAIAMMMEGKEFRIKRIILTGKQERASSWRQFGRQEIMRRRMNLQK